VVGFTGPTGEDGSESSDIKRPTDANETTHSEYPWTIVRTSRRKDYLDALEAGSADQNIVPFARFIREEMSVDWTNQAASPRSTGSGNGLA
jgi:hypothetical protein